jgi:hypothetical protein
VFVKLSVSYRSPCRNHNMYTHELSKMAWDSPVGRRRATDVNWRRYSQGAEI